MLPSAFPDDPSFGSAIESLEYEMEMSAGKLSENESPSFWRRWKFGQSASVLSGGFDFGCRC